MGLLSKATSTQVMTGRSGGLLRRLTMISRELAVPPDASAGGGACVPPPHPEGAAVPFAPGGSSASGSYSASGGYSTSGGSSTSGGGLLKKSLLFLHLEKEEVPGGESVLVVDYSVNIERLKLKISGLAKDFSFFPALYELLVRELRLPRSAFFVVHAARREFVPLMHRGLGPGTAAGLAFTEKNWAEENPRPAEPALIRDGRRLFPALSGPLPRPFFMFPFTDRGALEGSLLVGDFRVHPDSRASLFRLFASLSAAIGPTVSALNRVLKSLPRPQRIFRSPAEALRRLQAGEGGEGDSIHVLLVSLAPFLKTLDARYGCFDAALLRDTILYAVNCWFGGLGAGVAAGREDIVLVARDNRCYGPRLLARFVSDHLKNLFRGLFDDAPPLDAVHAVECPADSCLDPEAIIARLDA